MKYVRGKDKVPVHVRMDPFLIAALDFFAARARVSRSQLLTYCLQKALPKDLIPNEAVNSKRLYWSDYRLKSMKKALRSIKNKRDFQEATA